MHSQVHQVTSPLVVQEDRLEVQSPIAMKPVSFLAHRMDPGSPLYGKTQQDLLQERGFIVVRLPSPSLATAPCLRGRAW